jgi:hypothetical protein
MKVQTVMTSRDFVWQGINVFCRHSKYFEKCPGKFSDKPNRMALTVAARRHILDRLTAFKAQKYEKLNAERYHHWMVLPSLC